MAQWLDECKDPVVHGKGTVWGKINVEGLKGTSLSSIAIASQSALAGRRSGPVRKCE